MPTLEVIWLLVCGACWFGGAVSTRQAEYFDGDRDAHWERYRPSSLLHAPKHPFAIRAKRRGWVLFGIAAGLTTAGLLAWR